MSVPRLREYRVVRMFRKTILRTVVGNFSEMFHGWFVTLSSKRFGVDDAAPLVCVMIMQFRLNVLNLFVCSVRVTPV